MTILQTWRLQKYIFAAYVGVKNDQLTDKYNSYDLSSLHNLALLRCVSLHHFFSSLYIAVMSSGMKSSTLMTSTTLLVSAWMAERSRDTLFCVASRSLLCPVLSSPASERS